MNLFNLSLQLNGYPIGKAKKELDGIIKHCEVNLSSYQEERKWEIFNHHLKNNRTYKQWLGDKIFSDWHQIPVLKKSDIQMDVKDRLSIGYSTKNTHLHNTSGSSGTPFYFAKDKYCHALSWALIQNRFAWHGIEIGRDLQARFYGIPLSSWKYRKEKIKDTLTARVRFPVFDLSDSVLEKYLQRFHSTPFVYMNGYTSSLVMMAKYCLAHQVVLKSVCPTLKKVFTTSEVCDELDRKTMEEGFGVQVVNEYGAAELDLIGFEDAQGDWLLTHETLYIELLDEKDRPIKDGEEGRVIVTSLYNHAMPFIRYELGDRAILKPHTKKGYRLLERVTGRTNDMAVLPSGKRSPGLTFYYISKSLLEGGGFMKEFIIKQKTLHHFHYEYVAEREIREDEKHKIVEAMNQYLEPGLKATYERKNHIERTAAGKLKHFFSEIKTL